jgi:hypothetical protein
MGPQPWPQHVYTHTSRRLMMQPVTPPHTVQFHLKATARIVTDGGCFPLTQPPCLLRPRCSRCAATAPKLCQTYAVDHRLSHVLPYTTQLRCTCWRGGTPRPPSLPFTLTTSRVMCPARCAVWWSKVQRAQCAGGFVSNRTYNSPWLRRSA